jgi:hypothetical protein
MEMPSECAAIQGLIEDLEEAWRTASQDLESASIEEKPRFAGIVKGLNKLIRERRDDLVDCLAAHTDIPPHPTLGIPRIEVVQAVQTRTGDVGLVSGKPTAARVYLTSGLPGGAGFPQGTGFVAGVAGSLTVTDLLAGTTTTLQPTNAGGTATAVPAALQDPDREAWTHVYQLPAQNGVTVLRLDATATYAADPAVAPATATTTVTFVPVPRQEMLPILIGDPILGLQPPSRAAFASALARARAKLPVVDETFELKTPIETVLPPYVDLRVGAGWGLLVFNLATWVFLFPTQDVGGLRTALVPRNKDYAWGGMGIPRVGPMVPASATQANDGTSLAHELAHTYGVLHAPCPPYGYAKAPADQDTSIPGRLPEAGWDVPHRSVVLSGTPELMSYCEPLDQRWPSAVTWERIRTTIPI